MNPCEITKGLRRSIAAGLLILAYASAPAFAAALDVVALDASYPLRGTLLLISLVLLVSALALRIHRRRQAESTMPTGPDLRWWKQADAPSY